jgi:hypothetical protein
MVIVLQIWPRPLPSTFCMFHYLLVTALFDAIQSELHTISLKKTTSK